LSIARRRKYSVEYVKTTATVSSATTLSTCAMRSNSNMSPSTSTRVVKGCTATNAAVTNKASTEITPIQRRCASAIRRSSNRITQAADPKKISGLA
jgi:hypothetical protein